MNHYNEINIGNVLNYVGEQKIKKCNKCIKIHFKI